MSKLFWRGNKKLNEYDLLISPSDSIEKTTDTFGIPKSMTLQFVKLILLKELPFSTGVECLWSTVYDAAKPVTDGRCVELVGITVG